MSLCSIGQTVAKIVSGIHGAWHRIFPIRARRNRIGVRIFHINVSRKDARVRRNHPPVRIFYIGPRRNRIPAKRKDIRAGRKDIRVRRKDIRVRRNRIRVPGMEVYKHAQASLAFLVQHTLPYRHIVVYLNQQTKASIAGQLLLLFN